MTLKIGIDIGGVLRSRRSSAESQVTTLPQPPNPHALQVTTNLVRKYGKENIYIVSKCAEESEDAMFSWLRDNGVFDEVGVDPQNVYFCRLRTDKAPIARDLKLEYFVDDRAEVLESMRGIVNRRVMYSASGNYEDSDDAEIVRLSSWLDIESDLLQNSKAPTRAIL